MGVGIEGVIAAAKESRTDQLAIDVLLALFTDELPESVNRLRECVKAIDDVNKHLSSALHHDRHNRQLRNQLQIGRRAREIGNTTVKHLERVIEVSNA